jgi:ABC-type sugar transport system ATPase subunit
MNLDPSTKALECRGLDLTYPRGHAALRGVNLELHPGESLAILGPSGSGKSSLLRLVAGLERPTRGTIALSGRGASNLPPHARDLAMIFQNQLPYPHLSVRDNLAASARARRVPPADLNHRLDSVVQALGLSPFLDRRPDSLSGGERQRVVLGRALACRPSLLLLDEPFSNLDAPLRSRLRDDFAAWRAAHRVATILVTHDQADALSLADRIAFLDQGQIVQCGAAHELYESPSSPAVASFLGDPPINLLAAHYDPADPHTLRLGEKSLRVSLNDPSSLPAILRQCIPTDPVTGLLGIRPESPRLIVDSKVAPSAQSIVLEATVIRVEDRFRDVILHLANEAVSLRVRVSAREFSTNPPRNLVRVQIPAQELLWFPSAESAPR